MSEKRKTLRAEERRTQFEEQRARPKTRLSRIDKIDVMSGKGGWFGTESSRSKASEDDEKGYSWKKKQ